MVYVGSVCKCYFTNITEHKALDHFQYRALKQPQFLNKVNVLATSAAVIEFIPKSKYSRNLELDHSVNSVNDVCNAVIYSVNKLKALKFKISYSPMPNYCTQK